MAENKHSRKRTEKDRGLSRMIIIILTAAAVCLLAVMAVHMYREKKDAGISAETDMVNNNPEKQKSGSGDGSPDQNTLAKTESATNTEQPDNDTKDDGRETGNGTRAPLQDVIRTMTLEEKIAQMFIITPEALTGFEQVTDSGEATKNALMNYPVGGLVYFKPNLQNPRQVKEMISNTKEYAEISVKLPLLTAVDEEGGSVARIGGNPRFSVEQFPDMSQIGASGDFEEAYRVGQTIGSYLGEYGFNLDFAPVGDVLTNPDNRVVALRSFGSDPKLVSHMASQVAKGLMEQKVIPVYKHFPGHGSTKGDTHEGFSYTDRTLDELRESELVPFADAVKAGIPCIMAAHIAAVAVDGDTPASLSKILITDVLRGELGFDGVIITDALNMGAVQNLYSSGEAAVMAVEAGADILLMPADFKEAYETLLNAVREGRISEDRIDESLTRIGALKERAFLFD